MSYQVNIPSYDMVVKISSCCHGESIPIATYYTMQSYCLLGQMYKIASQYTFKYSNKSSTPKVLYEILHGSSKLHFQLLTNIAKNCLCEKTCLFSHSVLKLVN